METLFRSSTVEVLATEGRTLSGMASPYDRPTLVRDRVGGPFPGKAYNEAFSPSSGDVSMSQHTEWPLYTRHQSDADPLGTTTFQRSDSEGGTVFEATLSRTRDADDKLTLVNDGLMKSVSLGFGPVKALPKKIAGGNLLYRTEVAYRELSLCNTGQGQYQDAMVTAVRTAGIETPVLDAMKRRAARLRLS